MKKRVMLEDIVETREFFKAGFNISIEKAKGEFFTLEKPLVHIHNERITVVKTNEYEFCGIIDNKYMTYELTSGNAVYRCEKILKRVEELNIDFSDVYVDKVRREGWKL